MIETGYNLRIPNPTKVEVDKSASVLFQMRTWDVPFLRGIRLLKVLIEHFILSSERITDYKYYLYILTLDANLSLS